MSVARFRMPQLSKKACIYQCTIGNPATGLRQERERRAELKDLEMRFTSLSPRQRDVLPLVVKGLLNQQSAAALGITEVTLQISSKPDYEEDGRRFIC